jgi:acyl carrier protein phosphodiesterase
MSVSHQRATLLCASSFSSNLYNDYISDDDVREKRRNIRDKTSVSKHVSIHTYIDVLLNEIPKYRKNILLL